MWQYNYSEELCHHGILGMKWGHRKYKNEDGSLTPAGQKRASKEYKKLSSKAMTLPRIKPIGMLKHTTKLSMNTIMEKLTSLTKLTVPKTHIMTKTMIGSFQRTFPNGIIV